jgi:hypothetical protein
MRYVELIAVLAAALALVLWRGVALYRQTFKRNDL